jgi:hypothetical protein
MTILKSPTEIISLFVFVLTASIVFTSCRLTNSDVIGKWREENSKVIDTLYINSDNTFRLTRQITSGARQTNIDSTRIYIDGKWQLYKNGIEFTFNDTTQNIGRGCKFYQYMWTRGSKKTLARPDSCYYPSNRFHLIHKIE